MGKIIQFNTEYPEQMGEEWIYSNLTKEEKKALGKYRCEALKKAEEMHRNPREYTREDRKRLRRELEFAELVHKNNWSDEEAEAHWEDFNREKDEESLRTRKLFDKQWDMIYNEGKNLTEFEKRQTEKYMENHPEDANIIIGLVNMVAAGINDPEHIDNFT